jgi:hypothetical protein
VSGKNLPGETAEARISSSPAPYARPATIQEAIVPRKWTPYRDDGSQAEIRSCRKKQ